EEEPPLAHDPGAYTEETMSWLNELQGIVSAVTRDEEEEVVAPSDEFFSTPEDKAAFEEPAVGRGDEFEWPEPEPIEEPEPEESNWLSQLGAVTGTSEMEITQLDESDDDRPMPKLTGMLNRMRMAEEPPAQEEPSALFEDLPDREEPPSADDPLESLFMTEDLLSEAGTGFDSPPAQQETPAESEASGFGDDLSFDLDALMSDTPSQESATQDEVDFNAKSEASGFGDDLSFDLDSLMSDAPSQESSAQDEVDFNLDDVLADLPSASQGSEEWGASSEEDTASDEGDSFNFDDLLGGLTSESDSSPQNSLTSDEPEKPQEPEWTPPQTEDSEQYPANWGDAEQETSPEEEETYEPQWGIAEEETESEETPSESEEEAYDVQPLTAEAEETYEPQWGIAEEETESEVSPSETEEEAYDLQPLTAEASETYEPQWGIAEEEESEAESPDSDERGYDLPPLQVGASEPYEPQWGAVLDENSAENIAYSDTQENLEEPYEPQWGMATADEEPFAVEEHDQPAMSSPEGSTGELDDMSWLTDDIFAETRGLKPVNAEATGDAVFEQQAQSDDEPSHEDLLASQQAEP